MTASALPSRPPPRRQSRPLAKRLGVSAAVLTLALVALEVGLRLQASPASLAFSPESAGKRARFAARFAARKPTLFTRGHVHDKTLGWVPRPNLSRYRGIGTTPVSTNSQGMRGRREVSPRSAGLRIVCIGDSFTFGNDVRDDEVWTAQLEEELPGSEVLNLGVSGYGLDQAALRLEGTGLALEPSVVIWMIFRGDLERSMHDFTFAAKPRFRLVEGELEFGGTPVPKPEEISAAKEATRGPSSPSAILNWIHTRLHSTPAQSRAALNRAIVVRERERVRQAGARLLLVALGSKKRQPFQADHLTVLSWAKQLGVEVIDAEEVWQELEGFPFQETGHLTPAANEALAEELAARLRR